MLFFRLKERLRLSLALRYVEAPVLNLRLAFVGVCFQVGEVVQVEDIAREQSANAV